jgi:hypothetical protein
MVSHFTEHQYPAWTTTIRQHYWHLRYARSFDSARIRKEYRRIEAEKNRLLAAGIDAEGIRLLCRHMVNLENKNATRRWEDWCAANSKSLESGSVVIPGLYLTDETPKTPPNPSETLIPCASSACDAPKITVPAFPGVFGGLRYA